MNITKDNSKDVKLFEDANTKKEDEVIVDKNYIEAIQLKVKENIIFEKTFQRKKKFR